MSLESNKELVRMFNKTLNAPDWEAQVRKLKLAGMSPEQVEEWIIEHRAFRKTFPDYHSEILDLIAEGDKVVAIAKVTGTHRAEWPYYELKGIRATDLKLEWQEMQVFIIEDDALDVPYFLVDGVSRLQQLGVLP